MRTRISRLYTEQHRFAAFGVVRAIQNPQQSSPTLRHPRMVRGQRLLAKPGRTRQPARR